LANDACLTSTLESIPESASTGVSTTTICTNSSNWAWVCITSN